MIVIVSRIALKRPQYFLESHALFIEAGLTESLTVFYASISCSMPARDERVTQISA